MRRQSPSRKNHTAKRTSVIRSLYAEVKSLRNQLAALNAERAMSLVTPFPSAQDAPHHAKTAPNV